jgi:adenosylcobyric acid synthase
MLGERVSDPDGVEASAGTVEPGLALPPGETRFESLVAKITIQSTGQIPSEALRGLFARMQGIRLQTYQIHVGRTRIPKGAAGTSAFDLNGRGDGWLSADGWCGGGYLHGLFENEGFRHRLLASLVQRRSPDGMLFEPVSFNRQAEYDRWANIIRQHLDLELVARACALPMKSKR